jgi:oligoendopeptidase F
MQHMTEAMLFIPYGCLVDEFQHRVYDQPDLPMGRRHAIWRELEQIYLPDLDYAGEPYYQEGCSWQKKEHIFAAPFYYIDYVIAQIAALELWQLARRSPAQAWQSYDALCGMGGRDTFCGLLNKAGLATPFDTGTIKKIAYAVADFLDL